MPHTFIGHPAEKLSQSAAAKKISGAAKQGHGRRGFPSERNRTERSRDPASKNIFRSKPAKSFAEPRRYSTCRESDTRPVRTGAANPEPIATRTSHSKIKEDTMSVVINTNFAATVASNNLAASNTMLQKSLNWLSSGSKIVNPADDAGGLAVSMKLSAAAKRSGATITNIGNSISFLQTQDGVLKVTGKVLERIGELKTLYSDPTKNADDKANYDAEFLQLQQQLSSLTAEQFNSVSLFGSDSLTVTVSADSLQAVTVTSKDLADNTAGIGALTDTSAVSSLDDIALSDITDAIQRVATMRSNNGAEQSRLGFAAEVLTVNKANLEAANSRIVDVDVAEESTSLARWNILVQSGTAMLSQANQSSQIALKLLG
jgi:flagellin